MKKIQIQETKKADTRTLKPGDILSEKDVKRDTELHIEAVELCGDFLCDKIKKQFKEHDHTKLGEYLPAFTKALSTGFKGKEFKGQDWWQIHLAERHHLNDKVPENVNLIDVLEMICDCVSAGMARNGTVYDATLSNETLKKAFENTVKLIKDNIEVVPQDQDSKVVKKLLK